MKRHVSALLTLLCLVLLSVSGFAQDWAKQKLDRSPRHSEWVSIKSGDRTIHAFVVYPERKDKAPAVLVIHEIFGLTDWARSVADDLAAKGYVAIAPDLLSGAGPKHGGTDEFPDRDAAVHAVSKLDPQQVTADLNAAADYVKKLPASDGKLAVAGFCWGGGQSFRFATDRHDLSAAYVFYGPTPKDGLDKITAPVYGFYAGNDARITATVPETKDAMHKAGKTYDPVIYDGAGHGFMRAGEDPTDTDPANKKAREEAWKRWTELLEKL